MLHKSMIEIRRGFRGLSEAEVVAVSGGLSDGGMLHVHANPINDTEGKPLPTTWGETTFGQKACLVSTAALGVGPINSDIACGTDLSGNNPDQQGLTEEEKKKRLAEALKEAGEKAFDEASKLVG